MPGAQFTGNLVDVVDRPKKVVRTGSGVPAPILEDPSFVGDVDDPGVPSPMEPYSFGLPGLAPASGVDPTRHIVLALARLVLRESPLHVVAFMRRRADVMEPVAQLASLHLRVRIRRGRVILYGDRPARPATFLSRADEGRCRLTRVA